MSEEQGKPFEVVGDQALEARVVSWVLGEALDFEIEELKRLCRERPELEVFRRRIAAVHGLTGEALKQAETDWKLPAAKRDKVMAVIGANPHEKRRVRSSRFAARRVLLAAAACLALTAVVAALVFPLFFGARAGRKGSVDDFAESAIQEATPEGWAFEASATERDYYSGEKQEKLNAGTDQTRTRLRRQPAAGEQLARQTRGANLEGTTTFERIPEATAASPAPISKPAPSPRPARTAGPKIDLGKEVPTTQFRFAGKAAADGDADGADAAVAAEAPGLPGTDTLFGAIAPADPAASAATGSGHLGGGGAAGAGGKPLDRKTSFSGVATGIAGSIVKPEDSATEPDLIPDSGASVHADGTIATAGRRGRGSATADPFAATGLGDTPRYADSLVTRAKAEPKKASPESGATRDAAPRRTLSTQEHSELESKLMEGEPTKETGYGYAWRQRDGEERAEGREPRFNLPAGARSSGQIQAAQKWARDEAALAKHREKDSSAARPNQVQDLSALGLWLDPGVPQDLGAARPEEEAAANEEYRSLSLDVGDDLAERLSQLGSITLDDQVIDESINGVALSFRRDTAELLRHHGLALPEQANVFYDIDAGRLQVNAPQATLEDLQELIERLPKKPDSAATIDLMAEIPAQEEPFSTFSLHVSDASFRVAAAALERGERPDPETVRPEEFYNAFDYGDPGPTAGEPVACAIEQCAHPLLPSRNLVRVAVRTAAAGRGAGQALRLTVLLDNSGSMEREDRRAAVKAAMGQLGSLLGPRDLVTVVGFARQPRLLAERMNGEGAREKLADLVAQTPAEGGTNLEQALLLADELAMRQFEQGAQNRIVLLTDGAANLGNADPEALAQRIEGLRQRGVSFDAAGFGTAGMNDRLLERMARDGNGRYYVVDGPADADEQFAKKLAGAFRPAAENVKVQLRFNPARVGGYRLIGFEEHRLKKEDFRDDTVDAAEMASEESGVAVYQVELLPDGEGEIGEVSVRFRDPAKHRMVERSWTMPHDDSAPAFDRAPASMQLAGLALLAADTLRDGPLAPLTDWSALAPVSNQVRTEFGGSEEVTQLLQMLARLRE